MLVNLHTSPSPYLTSALVTTNVPPVFPLMFKRIIIHSA